MKHPARSTIRRYGRFVALLVALPCLMGAEIYRWVDENGVVNYTQQRPSNVDVDMDVEQITTRTGARGLSSEIPATPAPPAASVGENQQGDLTDDQQAMLERLRSTESVRQEQVAEIRTSNCKQARTMLQDLQARGRVRVRDGDGVRVMDEDERQQRISEAQEGVAVNCEA